MFQKIDDTKSKKPKNNYNLTKVILHYHFDRFLKKSIFPRPKALDLTQVLVYLTLQFDIEVILTG